MRNQTPRKTPRIQSKHELGSHAILNEIEARLRRQALTVRKVWDYFLKESKCESRTQISEKHWALIYCRLDAGRKDATLFNQLCKDVQTYVEEVQKVNELVEAPAGRVHAKDIPSEADRLRLEFAMNPPF